MWIKTVNSDVNSSLFIYIFFRMKSETTNITINKQKQLIQMWSEQLIQMEDG